jgi:beta-lactamase superfamily II metal-dependent hydrolase
MLRGGSWTVEGKTVSLSIGGRRDLLQFLAVVAVVSLLVAASVAPVGAAKPPKATPTPTPTPPPAAVPCASPVGWTSGEVTVYWFDVEQGDGQLIIGPTGKTLLIDLGETAFNSTLNSNATRIEARIREICGTGADPVALDYVMGSHHHLDHIGYAGVPDDTSNYGNGIYQLLTPKSEGGFGFTVGTLLDHDGGTWTDTNHDGRCEVGTSAAPSDEIAWHNAGTVSQTSRRWICWLYGPDGQADRANIQGHVVTLTNDNPWPSIDLGPGVTPTILEANAKDVMQADGITPVSGDHTGEATPPSENDYSIAFSLQYGTWRYATAGDSDGEYNSSSFGYSYNDIEAILASRFGDVDTMRANHHGSGHSSSQSYLDALKPESAVFSCGTNDFGHPSNRILDALRVLPNDRGTGTDAYLTNDPCDPYQADGTTPTDYSGTFNHDGDLRLTTTSGGTGYVITYDAGANTYVAYGDAAPTPTPSPTPTPTATPTPAS